MTQTSLSKQSVTAWVVAVNMGYGHQRPAHNLRSLAKGGEVIVANNYPGIPASDRRLWQSSRKIYEFISRFTHVPIIGPWVFSWFNRLQAIPPFYPARDLSKPSMQVKQIYRFIKINKWGKHLIEKLSKQPLPIVTTFFTVAFMAEEFNYPGEIFCVVTDTDVTRAWAPLKPVTSRIRYCAPTQRVADRLRLYGVPEKNIALTGFPLPTENIGGTAMTTLRHDMTQRLINLDPRKKYFNLYGELIQKKLRIKKLPVESDRPLTITFAVGGAGAQREIGALILHSLRKKILERRMRLILIAGIHNHVHDYFCSQVKKNGLYHELHRHVVIVHSNSKDEYFHLFNQAIRVTDVLWTKPSELSFYTALGIPIVMTPPIGAQEDFNRDWLIKSGSGVDQERPEFAHQWLFEWIDNGWCAEAAMQGFIEGEKAGLKNIEKLIERRVV